MVLQTHKQTNIKYCFVLAPLKLSTYTDYVVTVQAAVNNYFVTM